MERGGVGLVTPGLVSHGGEGLGEEMNEGGEECSAGIGGRTAEGCSFSLRHGGKRGEVPVQQCYQCEGLLVCTQRVVLSIRCEL